MLQNLNRDTLLQRAQAAKTMEKTQATAALAAACEELSA
jgi:UDP-N-acetylglucosamine--N-acetylmuramyl-(pentapeptide) pyrophosphoryl-undecaprenol N-acetylglucosamine transferase